MPDGEMNFGSLSTICKPNATTVGFDGRPAEVQSDAEPASLSRVKWRKWARNLVHVKARAGIADHELHLGAWDAGGFQHNDP